MRSFVTAIVVLILGIACLPGVRSISSSPLLNQVLTAKPKRSRTNAIDILRKSGRKALLITNYVIGAACFIAMFLFAVFKWEQLLTVTITLCAVLFLMLFVVVGRNSYYEKHE